MSTKYKSKKVLVLGFGTTGVAVTRYLVKQGAKVTVADPKSRAELASSFEEASDVKFEAILENIQGISYEGYDFIVLSPSVRPGSKSLEKAREAGIPIYSELDIFAGSLKEPLICVSGSNGKTTVVELIGAMFKEDGRSAFVGGVQDRPLSKYFLEPQKSELVVAEVSALQLEQVQKVIPSVAVFLNVHQDHLDKFGSVENYTEQKRKLLRACDKNTYVVCNYDNPITREFGNSTNGKLYWYTKQDPMKMGGAFAETFMGCYYNAQTKKVTAKFSSRDEIYDLSQVKLFGEHNKENIMAAICACRVQGVSPEAIQRVINQFAPLPSRLEFLRRKDGVYIFNDAYSTNPAAIGRALASFPANPIILVAGGRDKNVDFAALQEIVKGRCKTLIFMGEAKEKLNRALGDVVETFLVGTFDEAILLAFQKSRNGDILLLSPGCTHADQFKTFQERGDTFRAMVLGAP